MGKEEFHHTYCFRLFSFKCCLKLKTVESHYSDRCLELGHMNPGYKQSVHVQHFPKDSVIAGSLLLKLCVSWQQFCLNIYSDETSGHRTPAISVLVEDISQMYSVSCKVFKEILL